MSDPFSTTRWSLILASGTADTTANAALSELCEIYWRPVYAFIRHHGHAPDEAADLTQAFFLNLLEHRGFERADPARGRFRAYLVTSARNFLINAHAHTTTERRGAKFHHESIDALNAEREFALNAADPESTPDAVFEQQWALRVAERALEKLRQDYAERGQEQVFQDLRPYLTSHAHEDSPSAAAGLSPDAFRAALSRARRRYGEALRAAILETVQDVRDVDDELRHLLRMLST
jgi:RNA polymerase sigma factor (sigma-70 family)